MSAEADNILQGCFHCGQAVGDVLFSIGEKHFCCQGCKTVYMILEENNLTNYYRITESPGKKKEAEVFSDYAFLDLPEIRKEITSFSAAGVEIVSFEVPAIHCSSCIWLLENIGKLDNGIVKSKVNFLNKAVDLQYKTDSTSLRKIVELMDSIGYKPLIELKEKDKKRARRRSDFSFLSKIGVSGFAFGNIMLLSFPEYFSGGMYEEANFASFFAYVNLVLALPVFFYCSTPFFISAWKGLKARYLNIDVPLSLGILILFSRSTFEVVSGSGAGYFDSMTGLVFFLLIGRWFQNRTYQALSFERDYRNYFPLGVRRSRNGRTEVVLLGELELGDEIRIRNGEIVPADCLVLSGKASLDYSFVTGESDLVAVNSGDLIFAGGRQKGEEITLSVEKKFSQSYLMQLWKNESRPENGEHKLKTLIDGISHYFTAAIVLIAALSAAYWWKSGPGTALHVFTSVLIIACPCALAMTLPFTYGNGLRFLEKAGFYLRDSRLIDQLASIDDIIFDKTGTITSNGELVEFIGKTLTAEEKSIARSLSRHSSHALSRSIFASLGDGAMDDVSSFNEIEGHGISGICLGQRAFLGSSAFTGIAPAEYGSGSYFRIEDRDIGFFHIGNRYRPGLDKLLSELKPHYRIHVITGDGNAEEANLRKYFGEKAELHFNMDPFAKRAYVSALKGEGNKVLMIGDGLNDAGALGVSDIGISVSDEIYGFLPSCDAILEASSFSFLGKILAYSKKLQLFAVCGFGISFLYNIAGLSIAMQGVLSPVVAAVLMPLSSVTVVAFAVLSTSLSAFQKSPNKVTKNMQ